VTRDELVEWLEDEADAITMSAPGIGQVGGVCLLVSRTPEALADALEAALINHYHGVRRYLDNLQGSPHEVLSDARAAFAKSLGGTDE
jgi:hypothetical protein